MCNVGSKQLSLMVKVEGSGLHSESNFLARPRAWSSEKSCETLAEKPKDDLEQYEVDIHKEERK